VGRLIVADVANPPRPGLGPIGMGSAVGDGG
jgi:hypothetical protein